MDSIVLVCRSCHRNLRRTRYNSDGLLIWMCEHCNWRVTNGSERLDQLAYGRNASSYGGDENRWYPNQWGN